MSEGKREILFETVRLGSAVKVTAVDAGSGLEAAVIGTAGSDEAALRRLALRKLDYLRNRQSRG